MAKTNKQQEKSLLMAIKDITHCDSESYYIIWKYAPQLLPNGENIKTFEDLARTYKNFEGRTEQNLEKTLFKENVQKAIRYLLKRLDGKRDIDLLNKYYELAMSGNVQALSAYINFKETFFADNETNELKEILHGATIPDNDTDDFTMEL